MDANVLSNLRKRIILRAGLAAFGTFVLNTLGVWLGIYSIVWWYDMPMHFFGGLFTALLVISFFLRFPWFVNLNFAKTALFITISVFIVGTVWEFYEYFFSLVSGQHLIIIDSVSDIFFDLAGSIQALFIYFRHLRVVDPK